MSIKISQCVLRNSGFRLWKTEPSVSKELIEFDRSIRLSRLIYSYFSEKMTDFFLHSSHAAPTPRPVWVYVWWWQPHGYQWGWPWLDDGERTRSGKRFFSKPGLCNQPASSSKVHIFSQKMRFFAPCCSARGDRRPSSMGMGRVLPPCLYT